MERAEIGRRGIHARIIGVVINVATYMVQFMNRSAAKLKRLARTIGSDSRDWVPLVPVAQT
jgi:hypothetical protein